MGERRALSDQEVGDLVNRLRSLDWSWDPAEVDRVIDAFGWKAERRTRRSVRLDAGFGPGTGYVEFSRQGKVERIWVAACTSASAESAEGRAFVQDVFAQSVASAVRALGEPTQRIPGESPEVRWRGENATLGVSHSLVLVDVFLATNAYIDYLDRAAEQGL